MENAATCLSPRLIIRSFVAQHVAVRRPTHELWKSIMPDVIAREGKCEHVLSARPFFQDIMAQKSAKVAREKRDGMRESNFWS
ncbi:hypothetical protein SEA_SPILLED_93 [Streptomyces phage Spilled]|nr:hypothetical protein SEA_SPILLED_93 [Streptomyces phage Spilled]